MPDHYEPIEYEGQELYLQFFHERLRTEGLDEDDDVVRPALEALGEHDPALKEEEHVPHSVREKV